MIADAGRFPGEAATEGRGISLDDGYDATYDGDNAAIAAASVHIVAPTASITTPV